MTTYGFWKNPKHAELGYKPNITAEFATFNEAWDFCVKAGPTWVFEEV